MSIKRKILIVDDEPGTRHAMEALLYQENYELLFATSGQEAISKLAELSPDVILLDVMMPGMDGFEVCQFIKSDKQWQHIPIILVTALGSKKDLVRGIDSGADDFLSKPVSGLELSARVRSMLRIKNQYDQLEQQRKDLEDALQVKEALARVTAQRLEELEVIYQSGLDLMNSLDAYFMSEKIAHIALRLIPKASLCLVHLLEEDEVTITPQVFPSDLPEVQTRLSLDDEMIIRDILDSKETIHSADATVDLPYIDLSAYPLHSLLIVPMIVDERAIGTISLDSPEVDVFEIADRRILSILANQLAVSIMKARLFETLSGNQSHNFPKADMQTTFLDSSALPDNQ